MLNTYLPLARRLFLTPFVLHPYEEIIMGTRVCGKSALQKAVGKNTFRGFYRKAGFPRGASAVFDPFFLSNKHRILTALRSITTREGMDGLCDTLSRDLRAELVNVEERQLVSYNKVRKPVDLYLEHIVAMAEEFSATDRARLVPTLFLPLDSWIFREPRLFSDHELQTHGLTRSSTYKDVANRDRYLGVHALTVRKAAEMGPDFHPIFFDLIWGNRYQRQTARNLFESNP